MIEVLRNKKLEKLFKPPFPHSLTTSLGLDLKTTYTAIRMHLNRFARMINSYFYKVFSWNFLNFDFSVWQKHQLNQLNCIYSVKDTALLCQFHKIRNKTRQVQHEIRDD